MGAYPVPSRARWSVAVEFLDGTRIEGTSDADVIDRWSRLQWTVDCDAATLKRAVVARARGFMGAVLLGIDDTTPDDQFLDALAAEGVVYLNRK
jgi:hypothetical protein